MGDAFEPSGSVCHIPQSVRDLAHQHWGFGSKWGESLSPLAPVSRVGLGRFWAVNGQCWALIDGPIAPGPGTTRMLKSRGVTRTLPHNISCHLGFELYQSQVHRPIGCLRGQMQRFLAERRASVHERIASGDNDSQPVEVADEKSWKLASRSREPIHDETT
jgi:hypothetical protein